MRGQGGVSVTRTSIAATLRGEGHVATRERLVVDQDTSQVVDAFHAQLFGQGDDFGKFMNLDLDLRGRGRMALYR